MVVLLVSRLRVRVQGNRQGQLHLRRLVPGKVGQSVAQHARQVRDCARVLHLSTNHRHGFTEGQGRTGCDENIAGKTSRVGPRPCEPLARTYC